MSATSSDQPKSKRGFASMSQERRRAIASMGGKSVPTEKRSFSRRRDLASEAGRKGGLAPGRHRRTSRP
jgi:general stress protein YciG